MIMNDEYVTKSWQKSQQDSAIWHNIVACLLNHCWSGHTTVNSVYCWDTCHCQPYKNIECYTTMLLWQIYVASNNRMYIGLNVKGPMLHWNKRIFICSWPYLDVQLDKEIVITGKLLHIFSLFVSFAIPFYKIMKWISHEAVSIKYYECVSVFLP